MDGGPRRRARSHGRVTCTAAPSGPSPERPRSGYDTEIREQLPRSGLVQLSLALYRTQLFDPDDLDDVRKVQDGYKVRTLSGYLDQPPPPPAPSLDFPKIDKELVKTNFFEYLDFALQLAPPDANETAIRAQLARIGVGPGRTFAFKDLSVEDKLEIGLGMKEGERKVDEAVAAAGKDINGWRVSTLQGDSAFFDGDWLKRALLALAVET